MRVADHDRALLPDDGAAGLLAAVRMELFDDRDGVVVESCPPDDVERLDE